MTPGTRHQILIIEDEMIIAADLSLQLTKLGYEVTGIQTRAEDALKTLEQTRPDIILMDIVLSGEMNGIDAAQIVFDKYKIPVIFLTSNFDDATFEKAKATKPYAFISKPFRKDDLRRAIEITLERISDELIVQAKDEVGMLDDRLFVRDKDSLVKVKLSEIQFLEAERSYCKISTADRQYLVSTPMGSIEKILPPALFARVHRSFIVNLEQIESISDHSEYLTIQQHTIPISRRLKEEVTKRFRMI